MAGAKDYLHKEDYGRTPAYLSKIKEDIEAEYDYIRRLQAEEEGVRRLPCTTCHLRDLEAGPWSKAVKNCQGR